MAKSNVAVQSIIGIPLALYGYALQKTWGAIEGVMVDFPTVFQTGLITLCAGALALGLALAARRLGAARERRGLFLAGMALQAASAALDALIVVLGLADLPFILASFFLKSIGTIVVSALWIELFATLNPVRSGFLCAASTALSALMLYVMEGVAGPHLVVLRLALTVFSGVLYWLAWRRLADRDGAPADFKPRFALPLKGMALVAAYAFAYGMASYMLHANNVNYAAAIPATLVMVLIVANARSFNSSSLSRLALPLMIGGFTLASFASIEFNPVASVMLDTGYGAIEIILLLMVCGWAYSTGMSPIWMFGLLSASQFFGNFLGFFLASQLHAQEGTATFVVLEIFAIVIVAAISPMMASEKSLAAFWKGAADPAEASVPEDRLKLRVDELAAKHGLTTREVEVLQLAAQGKTNAAIAADMVLSEGTIKTHLHHVYRKFGISTRAELMKLVGK